MNRTSILNFLITAYNYKSYLEIGKNEGYNFNNIIIDNKKSIDPNPNTNPDYVMTSDETWFPEHNFSRRSNMGQSSKVQKALAKSETSNAFYVRNNRTRTLDVF